MARGICIICLILMVTTVRSQVIYERTFTQVSPSIRQTIQLSDTASIGFGSVSDCRFAPFYHIDKNGNRLGTAGFSLESTHYSGVRIVGIDSILVWGREGATDFDGPNYLVISLWTPSQFVTLIRDSLHYRFWEDQDVPYEAYHIKDDKLLYRKADSLYVVKISTQQQLNKVIIPHLGHVYAFLDHIVTFPDSADPIIFSIDLLNVATWNINQSSSYDFEQMAIDSFLVGHNTQEEASLHIVNGMTGVSFDLDLSGYLTDINDIQINDQGLFVKGKKEALDYLIQINEQLQVVNETVVDTPDIDRPLSYTYYPDRVYITTTDGISEYDAEYRISYYYADADPIRYVDISLDTIWVDSVFYWPHEMHLPANLFLLAKITNHSPDTINSLTYHFENPPFIFCDPGVYPTYINGLSIPPGEIATVPFRTSSWEVAENKPLIRTFYVEHANHHLDSEVDDNHFQLIYLLSNNNRVVYNEMSIWPNPFIDHLETSGDFYSLRLYDNLGQVVSSGTNRLDNLSGLTPGAYCLLGYRDQISFISRVIKVE